MVADLSPLPSEARRTKPAPRAADTALAPADAAEPKRVAAIFSSVERRGAWVVPPKLKASAVFGAVVLDFREASFQPGVTELEVRALFGALEILVPPELAVECDGSAVLASWEGQGATAVADPDRPLLRVTGRAVLGSVEVHTRLPGESHRDARRRQKRERKELRKAERPALPAPDRE